MRTSPYICTCTCRHMHIHKPTCPSVHVRVSTCQSRGVCVCVCTCACTLAHLCTLACHATRRRGRPFYHRCWPSLAATYDLRPPPSSRGPQRLSRHSPPPGRTSPAPTWAPCTPGRARTTLTARLLWRPGRPSPRRGPNAVAKALIDAPLLRHAPASAAAVTREAAAAPATSPCQRRPPPRL